MPKDFNTKMRDFFRKRERDHAKVKAKCETLYWMLKRKGKLLPKKMGDRPENNRDSEYPAQATFEWGTIDDYAMWVKITANGYVFNEWDRKYRLWNATEYKKPSQILKHIPDKD